MPRERKSRRRTPPPSGTLARHVGTRLRVARTAAGLTQAELGAPYYTRSHVSAIEAGKLTPSLKGLAFFARKIGVSMGELLPTNLPRSRKRQRYTES